MVEELTQEKIDNMIPNTKEEVVVAENPQNENITESLGEEPVVSEVIEESDKEVDNEVSAAFETSEQTDHDGKEESVKPEEKHRRPRKKNPKFSAQWRKTYFRHGDSYEEDMELSREDYILTRVPDSDLMEYLRMEREKNEKLQLAREERERRIFKTLQMILLFATIIAVVGLLKDEPLVLMNILYIAGIVLAVWFYKKK